MLFIDLSCCFPFANANLINKKNIWTLFFLDRLWNSGFCIFTIWKKNCSKVHSTVAEINILIVKIKVFSLSSVFPRLSFYLWVNMHVDTVLYCSKIRWVLPFDKTGVIKSELIIINNTDEFYFYWDFLVSIVIFYSKRTFFSCHSSFVRYFIFHTTNFPLVKGKIRYEIISISYVNNFTVLWFQCCIIDSLKYSK